MMSPPRHKIPQKLTKIQYRLSWQPAQQRRANLTRIRTGNTGLDRIQIQNTPYLWYPEYVVHRIVNLVSIRIATNY